MPEAICDTSPIQYLHQLKLLDLLPRLYGDIFIPRAVADELAAGVAAGVDVPDSLSLPWAQIRDVTIDAALTAQETLGPGEREALSLALQNPDTLIIIDDGVARLFARQRKLRFTGTLGVLVRAKSLRFIENVENVAPQLRALRDRGFRMSLAVEAMVLARVGESREAGSS